MIALNAELDGTASLNALSIVVVAKRYSTRFSEQANPGSIVVWTE